MCLPACQPASHAGTFRDKLVEREALETSGSVWLARNDATSSSLSTISVSSFPQLRNTSTLAPPPPPLTGQRDHTVDDTFTALPRIFLMSQDASQFFFFHLGDFLSTAQLLPSTLQQITSCLTFTVLQEM